MFTYLGAFREAIFLGVQTGEPSSLEVGHRTDGEEGTFQEVASSQGGLVSFHREEGRDKPCH